MIANDTREHTIIVTYRRPSMTLWPWENGRTMDPPPGIDMVLSLKYDPAPSHPVASPLAIVTVSAFFGSGNVPAAGSFPLITALPRAYSLDAFMASSSLCCLHCMAAVARRVAHWMASPLQTMAPHVPVTDELRQICRSGFCLQRFAWSDAGLSCFPTAPELVCDVLDP